MLPCCFEGLCLPRLWCCAENVPDEDQRVVLALEPRALPRGAHQCTTADGSSSRRSALSSPRPSLIFFHSCTKASPASTLMFASLGRRSATNGFRFLSFFSVPSVTRSEEHTS